jgi:hypothetical protein
MGHTIKDFVTPCECIVIGRQPKELNIILSFQVAVPSIPVDSSNKYGSSIECVQNWTKGELEHWLEKNQLNG